MKKTDGGRLYGEEPKMDVIESSETSKDDEVVEDVLENETEREEIKKHDNYVFI